MGTEQGFTGASRCLQVFGGHGYIREWGIEQIVRDSRVAMIYEGTNEIQAIDLLARKVLADGGIGIDAVLAELQADVAGDAQAASALQAARDVTRELVAAAEGNPVLPYEAADDYLRLVGLGLLAWAWHRIERTPGAQAPRWAEPAAAVRLRVLPEAAMRQAILGRQCAAAAARAA